MREHVDTPVLIVGGGPVGLALALDLAWRGNRSLLVEREPGTASVLLAKAGTLNERTMEICRRWGIADRVAHAGFPDDFTRDTIYCTSLDGHVLGRDPMPSARDRRPPPTSAEMLRKCPQFWFDPILAQAVQERGLTDIRYGTEFLDLAQDDAGVDVRVREVGTGRVSCLRASYVVACDGAGSRIRRALGIPFEGRDLSFSTSAMVRVRDLASWAAMGQADRYMFVGPGGTWANLTSVDGQELWRFTLLGSAQRAAPTEADMADDIRRAFGRSDIPFTIERLVHWRRSEYAAGAYRAGRILLAGDSAHTMSPTGGHGLNTGLGDAFGLGWILDAVLKGWGGDGLLTAYGAERRPVAMANSAASSQNYGAWVAAMDFSQVMTPGEPGDAIRRTLGEGLSAALQPEWWSLGIGLGYSYDTSPVVVPDGSQAPDWSVSLYTPTSRPGHRAPHAWMSDGRSTIDLFGRGFVLLRFGPGPVDVESMVRAAAAAGMPFEVVDITDPAIAALYERRLVLVRPDGHTAWRGDTLPPEAASIIDRVRGAQMTVAERPQRAAVAVV